MAEFLASPELFLQDAHPYWDEQCHSPHLEGRYVKSCSPRRLSLEYDVLWLLPLCNNDRGEA